MRRREFIALLGGATAWPISAQAQQIQKVPVIGFLHPGFPEAGSPVFGAVREGLRNAGYIEGETIKLEARWAHGKPEMLPKLTKELVELRAKHNGKTLKQTSFNPQAICRELRLRCVLMIPCVIRKLECCECH